MELKLRNTLVKEFETIVRRHGLDQACLVETDLLADFLVSSLEAITQTLMDNMLRDPEFAGGKPTYLHVVKASRPPPRVEDDKDEK